MEALTVELKGPQMFLWTGNKVAHYTAKEV